MLLTDSIDFTNNLSTKQIIIKFKDASQKNLEMIKQKYNISKYKRVFPDTKNKQLAAKLGLNNYYRIYIKDQNMKKELLKDLNQELIIENAEPNVVAHSTLIPNDDCYCTQWGPKHIEAAKGWSLETGKENITIAVLDTGISLNHPDLKPNLVQGYDMVDITPDEFITSPGWELTGDYLDRDFLPIDEVGHGTHVAGIIAAVGNNAEGIAGVTWHCRVMPVKVLTKYKNITTGQVTGIGLFDDISAGVIQATDAGADIINLSLGSLNKSLILEDAINYTLNQDVTIIAAMGNENIEEPSYPAAFPGVIAVGSINKNDQLSDFSNSGDHIDLVAPGEDIMSSYLNNGYKKLSGTSMAAPHVAGLVGLIKSINPSLSNNQIQNILFKTATDLGKKGFDKFYGWGKINIFEALKLVLKYPDGTLIKDNNSSIYIIEDGKLHHIPTSNIFYYNKYNPNQIIEVSSEQLALYPLEKKKLFPPGTLIKTKNSSQVYFIEGRKKRRILSAKLFAELGFKTKNIITVTKYEFNLHSTDPPIKESFPHLNGTLLKGNGPAIYVIENGMKRYIPSLNIFNTLYRSQNIIKVPDEIINKYQDGPIKLFKDGTLIRSNPNQIYIFYNYSKHLIPNFDVFNAFKFKYKNIIKVSKNELELIPTGPPLI
ncbi:S8 family peptidase [Selenihalanaerobacter shriftii]|uniref:Subtilase family protein n=1 Tax=Selenihalanaerobacter shriftii TaxID=142842 RepID=A0A1T4N7A9_9FIRM|nr:S8 family peptidase [Selenihalanaerobacter shriftii]SJZ75092.1 Subtilase family protein [Selenihalanaerobacter shriftii]